MPEAKTRTYKYFFWLILLFSGSIFFSCADEDCISIFNNHLLVSFIEADTLETGEIEFNEIDTLFYSVMAEGNDSVFYTADTLDLSPRYSRSDVHVVSFPGSGLKRQQTWNS